MSECGVRAHPQGDRTGSPDRGLRRHLRVAGINHAFRELASVQRQAETNVFHYLERGQAQDLSLGTKT